MRSCTPWRRPSERAAPGVISPFAAAADGQFAPSTNVAEMDLPKDFVALMRGPSPCFITTLMPDGSPQTTQTWVDTDGEHVVINTVQSHLKVKNIHRDPRVSVAICDASNFARYYAVRGRVVKTTTEGGAEHIEALSQRYTGG